MHFLPLLSTLALADAEPATPGTPVVLPSDDYTRGIRTTRTGLYMGAVGAGAVAVGFPTLVVGGLMAWGSPNLEDQAVAITGGLLTVGGALTLVAGPFVSAAGELQARKGMSQSPGKALPFVVIGAASATVLIGTTAIVAGQDGDRALPFLGAAGATLAGAYVCAGVDLIGLEKGGPAQLVLLPTPGGLAMTGTF